MKHMQDCASCVYNSSFQRSEWSCEPSWAEWGRVKDSILLWADSSLEPSFLGLVCPSWYQKGSSLLWLVPASRTATSTPPTVGLSILQGAIWRGKAGHNSLWKLLALSQSWHPGGLRSWPLHSLSFHVKKLIVPFSFPCQLLPGLQIIEQISKADLGFPWEMQAATLRFLLNKHKELGA